MEIFAAAAEQKNGREQLPWLISVHPALGDGSIE